MRKKRILIAVIGVVFLLSAVLPLVFRERPAEVEEAYDAAFQIYLDEIQEKDLIHKKTVNDKDGSPIFLLLTPPTGEVPDEEIADSAILIAKTAQIFNGNQGLKQDDFGTPFQQPQKHQMILIKRPKGFPDPIGDLDEMTLVFPEKAEALSIINFAKTRRDSSGETFGWAWPIIQAVCLGFAIEYEDSDPVCNIISANTAAGWARVERKKAEATINGYGAVDLPFGSQEYQFRFIDTVYEAFYGVAE